MVINLGNFLFDKVDKSSAECFSFPMGERHLRLQKFDDYTLINYQWPQNIWDIGLAVSACREAGIQEVHLYCPYIPYARQDRVCVKGDSFSLKVFADFLNVLNLTSVCSIDIHSDRSQSLINNITNIDQSIYAMRAIEYSQPDYLICPDMGAAKKIKTTQAICGLPIVYCEKVRNPNNGQLSGFAIVEGKEHVEGKGLIIDDICDGGGTFVGLRSLFDGDVSLYTTHGGYTKGFRPLSVFSEIITTNSINHVMDMVEINKLKINFKDFNVW